MRLNFIPTKNEELYIEMCHKAKELQKNWEPKIGDICIDMGDLWIIHNETKRKYVTYCKEADTWLPTEEQFQEMLIAPTMERPVNLLSRFLEWSEDFIEESREYNPYHDNSEYRKFTIKQLWFCYYMGIKYSKVWRNGNWRDII